MIRCLGKGIKFSFNNNININNKKTKIIVVITLVFLVCCLPFIFCNTNPSACNFAQTTKLSFSPNGSRKVSVPVLVSEGTVNVKQFGAFGDGVHDDTKAIQSAVDSATEIVVFPHGKYKCGQINVSKNICIDCQNSSFVATEDKLFSVCGKVTKTLENQASYFSNQTDYTIPDNYTGFGKVLGNNNFEPKRASYRGGMVTWFKKGLLTDTIPVDATTPTISEIMPISCVIKNIGGVAFKNTTDGIVVFIQYGVKCLVKNIKINSDIFSVVFIKDSNDCEISHVVANLPVYKGNKKFIYPIFIETSTYTLIHDCIIDNPFWHCLSGGGAKGICLNTLIQNCTFTSKTQLSICDHANCIGTRIENCECSGIGVGPSSQVRDCLVTPLKSTTKRCQLFLFPPSVKDLANYSVENVLFVPARESDRCGLYFAGFSQTFDNVVYISNAFLRNVKLASVPDNGGGVLGFSFNDKKFKSVKLGNIIIEDCNLRSCLSVNNRSIFDTSDFKVTYKNCETMRSNKRTIWSQK